MGKNWQDHRYLEYFSLILPAKRNSLMQEYVNLGIVTLITFFFNMPWGYWRASVKKFSWKWFLAVHLPIPVIIFMRFYFKLGFQLYTYPFLVGAFFLGQFVGARYYKRRKATAMEVKT